jgi:acyl transferase domain-containing protein/NADPH:quinone reductase-like Zn-dependent oxidoreductase
MEILLPIAAPSCAVRLLSTAALFWKSNPLPFRHDCARVLVYLTSVFFFFFSQQHPYCFSSQVVWDVLLVFSRVVATLVLLLAGFATLETAPTAGAQSKESPSRRARRSLERVAQERLFSKQSQPQPIFRLDSTNSSRSDSPAPDGSLIKHKAECDSTPAPTRSHHPEINSGTQPDSAHVHAQPLPPNAVAITGFGMRFPGGISTPSEFWDVLANKRCVLEENSASRWNMERFFDPGERVPGHFCAPHFGIVPKAEHFDPAFFSISAADAEAMDPQQRMFLMCVIDALDRSGIPYDTLRGTNAGVWVGTSVMEYLAAQTGDPMIFNAHSNPGIALCVIANRVSFFLGTRGPSMAVDTACASSLTALELAWRAVEDGRCQVAMVGGTNNLLLPEMTVSYSHMGVLARDGRCKSFDARADGYARGEGYGCLVLKPLRTALADGNPVLAVLRGCLSNANGDLTTGLTKPSLQGQANLIVDTWAHAGLDLASVDYVEAHGTGTAVGDPIEANAIGSTLGRARRARGLPPLPICSNKANLGHMEPAAAMGSLIKACLMIQNRTLLPQALFVVPHPDIDWEENNLCVLKQPTAARRDSAQHPLTIAINAFGFGGSNSHAILQAYHPQTDSTTTSAEQQQQQQQRDHGLHGNQSADNTTITRVGWSLGQSTTSSPPSLAPATKSRPVLLPLSANSSDSLRALALRWEKFSSDGCDASIVAACAAQRRVHHTHRAVVVASSSEDFAQKASKFGAGDETSLVVSGKAATHTPSLCFVFSGQGPQHKDMGRELFAFSSVFREMVLQCDRIFQQHAGHSFLESTGLFVPGASARVDMDRPEAAQPAICFFQMGLYAQLVAWGLKPKVVLGHSVGEVAAAWAAGKLTLDETIHLIFVRAREQQKTEGKGGMLAVACSRARAEAILAARGLDLSVAAVNSPSSVTLGGSPAAIAEMRRLCKEVYGLQSAVLGVRCAYHTPQMNPIRDSLLQSLGFLDNSPSASTATSASLPLLFSSVSGKRTDAHEPADAQYWWRNVREEVSFLAAMQALSAETSPDIVVELSSRPALVSLIRQTVGSAVHVVGTSDRAYPDESQQLLAAVAQCWVRGAAIDWVTFANGHAPTVPLPLYPFKEEHYMKCSQTHKALTRRRAADPFLAAGMQLSLDLFPWLADHVVGGNAILSATTFIEILLETVRRPAAAAPAVLKNLAIERAAPIAGKDVLEMAALPSSNGGGGTWQVTSATQTAVTGRTVHCSARLVLVDGDEHETSVGPNAFNPASSLDGYTPLDFVDCASLEALRSLLNSSVSSTAVPASSISSHPQRKSSIQPRVFTACDAKQVYKTFVDMGFCYGPAFALISELWVGDEEAVYIVNLPLSHRTAGYRFHPAVLDACLHGALMCAGSWSVNYIPVGLAHLELDAIPVQCESLVVHAQVAERGIESLLIHIDVCCVFSPRTALPPRRVAVFRGLRARPMVQSDRTPRIATDTLLRMHWQSAAVTTAGVPLLESLYTLCSASRTPKREAELQVWNQAQEDLQRLVACFAHLSLCTRGTKAASPRFEESLARLAALVPASARLLDNAGVAQLEADLRARLPFYAVELDIIHALGTQLCDISASPALVGDLIYRPELLPKFFRESFTVESTYESIAAMVEKLAEPLCAQGRVVRILEVGLRTGGLTVHVARRLSRWGAAGLVNYIASDLASMFFADAEQRLGEFPWVRTQRFNIESDAELQGLASAAFDIIIVFSTLHGVVDIPAATTQLHALLAPGGVLINTEPSEPSQWWLMEMWFVAMDVWWRMGDFRTHRRYFTTMGRTYPTCWMTSAEWVSVFAHSGGFDVVVDLARCPLQLLFNTLVARKHSDVDCTDEARIICGPHDEVEVPVLTRQSQEGSPPPSPSKASQVQHQVSPQKASAMAFVLEKIRAQAFVSRVPLWPRVLADRPLHVFSRSLDMAMIKVLAGTFAARLIVHSLPAHRVAEAVTSVLSDPALLPATIVFHAESVHGQGTDTELLTAEATECYTAALAIAHKIAGPEGRGDGSTFVLMTDNALGPRPQLSLAGGLQGFARALASEMDLLNVGVIDLDAAAGPASNTRAVVDYLRGMYVGEGEIVFRAKEGVLVPRLGCMPLADDYNHAIAREFVVEGDGKGSLSRVQARWAPPRQQASASEDAQGKAAGTSLQSHAEPTKSPIAGVESPSQVPAGQIDIVVHSACLNFKDVLVSLNMLGDLQRPAAEGDLGFGCVGTVVAVGPAHSTSSDHISLPADAGQSIPAGSMVVALVGGCLASRVLCPTALACPVPPSLATQLRMLACITLYATAYDALVLKARARAGETVLIHSAASGLGQCAIQLAQHIGCTVIASCGSQRKRDFLQAQFGLTQLTDSRRPTVFAADVRRFTNARGVDIVLNSLAGQAQQVTLQLCAPAARFVEVGKRDMLQAHTLNQAPLLHNVSFLSCQLDIEAEDHPQAVRAILQGTLDLMASGAFSPISTDFVPLSSLGTALHHASRGDTFTKPVFDLSTSQLSPHMRLPPARRQFTPDAACLITGGLGGVGLVVARMLAWRGAKHLVLVSRRANSLTRRQQNEIAVLESLGARVHVRACDTGDRSQVMQLVSSITRESHLRLEMVVHLAAVLSDSRAASLSQDALMAPISTKGFGALYLHEATAGCALRSFVSVTSTQDLVGVEQASYVTGNVLTQQLMLARHHQGLPSCVVALGPVLGAGMVERDRGVARVLSSRGAGFISVNEAASAIAEAAVFPAALPPFLMTSRIDGVITNLDTPLARGNSKWLHLLRPASCATAASLEDAALLARQMIADIFCLALDDVDTATPLLSFGVDSLVATELLSFFRTRLRLDVSYTDVLAGLSIDALLARACPA